MSAPRLDTDDYIIEWINAERFRQNKQWGGVEHDRTHTADDWLIYIDKQSRLARDTTLSPDEYDARLVKIAALAIAALEARHCDD